MILSMVSRAVVALVALAMAGAGSAATPSPQMLLARHVPVVVLHPAERFRPVPVDGFLADSNFEQRQPDGSWAPMPFVPNPGAPWRLNQRQCAARDGITAIDCYAAAEAAHGASPTVYGAYHRRADRIALQYWLFYPFNPYSTDVPPNPRFAQVHEGDWEVVTVILDRAGRPLTAAYSRHCSGVKRVWAKVPKRGQRPVVYVALGSHANYFASGTWPHEARCWPELAVSVLQQNGKALRDYTGRGRSLSPRLARVTASSPSWMEFSGAWGEDQFIFIADGVITYGLGPTGPVLKPIWRSPIRVPVSWPNG
jgi:hypothetical protein